jgi:uncharacterized SAM-binding protein YcdF (DUF218 family)
MKSLLAYFLDPFSSILTLILLGLFFRWVGKRTASRVLFIVGVFYFLAASTSFVPNYLIGRLESQYPVFSVSALRAGTESVSIIVLGAGHGYNTSLPSTDRLYPSTLGRLVEAVRIYKMLPKATVIGSAGQIAQPVSQAQAIAEGAVALGVAPEDTLQLQGALNTWEEADMFLKRFGKGTRVVVATDAVHMPRAMKLFKSRGLQPIAAPTNHIIKTPIHLKLSAFLPSTGSLRKTEIVMHEYIGMLWAKWVLL